MVVHGRFLAPSMARPADKGGSGPVGTVRVVMVARGRRVGNRCHMRTQLLDLHTGGSESITDITGACRDFTAEAGGDGLLHVFVPHATAGVAIIELGAGSDDDLLAALDDLLPADDRWRHRHGSPGHGRSHVMPALIPPYATIPVTGGRPELGTWQSIAIVDLNVDNPNRQVRLSFLTSAPERAGW
ncbi:hypothetical protein GCM10009799_11830 [Nocardiopsis rhodophaea]|uniref:Secondary thiamine-phosphate synthase enzyme n=2 Tax=Nocardiopsis rhodophaea TaxID=280238 RepID=A0ABN2SJI6_9ACTN